MSPIAIRSLSLAFFGTVLEYYDYALYGFFAPVFSAQFFPHDHSNIALMKTFAIFMAGSLAKPLGAFIFGSIGDRFGRRLALQWSMIGIMLPTLLMAVLPSYDDVGATSAFLLLLCRLMQGVCSAGESDGIRIYVYESISKTRACFAGSIAGLACMLGICLASWATSLLQVIDPDLVHWRILYVCGGVSGLLIYGLRRHILESDDWAISQRSQTGSRSEEDSPYAPFLETLKRNSRAMIATIMLCGSVGGCYHFYLVFYANYLAATLGMLDPIDASFATSQAILIYTVSSPLGGWLADYFGPRRVLFYAALGLMTALLLNLWFLAAGMLPSFVMNITAAALAFFQAPGFVVLYEHFAVKDRYRCASLGHALGSMLFSGSTPLISMAIFHLTSWSFSPLIYFAFLISMGLGAALLLGERRNPSVAVEPLSAV